jgi:hypothetical protein
LRPFYAGLGESQSLLWPSAVHFLWGFGVGERIEWIFEPERKPEPSFGVGRFARDVRLGSCMRSLKHVTGLS